jgi:hypothetical protein
MHGRPAAAAAYLSAAVFIVLACREETPEREREREKRAIQHGKGVGKGVHNQI